MPGWRNGRRTGLKILRSQGHEGSTPSLGTTRIMIIKQHSKLFNLKIPKALKIVYVHGKGLGIFAKKSFRKGETVIYFKADIVPRSKASPEAVQINEAECFDTKWLVPEAFINHSCAPNAKLDVEGYRYVAIRDIRKNEEITFDYCATEWDFKGEGFACRCGTRKCYGTIRGLKHLSKQQQEKLEPLLLPFLLKKIK